MTNENENKGNFFARFLNDYFDLCDRNKVMGPAFGIGFIVLVFTCLIISTVESPTELSLRHEIYRMKEQAKADAWMADCLKDEKKWKCDLLMKSPGSPWQWLDLTK